MLWSSPVFMKSHNRHSQFNHISFTFQVGCPRQKLLNVIVNQHIPFNIKRLSIFCKTEPKTERKSLLFWQPHTPNTKHCWKSVARTHVGLAGNNDQSATHVCFYTVHTEHSSGFQGSFMSIFHDFPGLLNRVVIKKPDFHHVTLPKIKRTSYL